MDIRERVGRLRRSLENIEVVTIWKASAANRATTEEPQMRWVQATGLPAGSSPADS